jgi:hypothetical protein
MITNSEISQFDSEGAVTIDTPLTPEEIAAADIAISEQLPFKEPSEGEETRYRHGASGDIFHPALVNIIQHPFFEEVAKRALRAEEVKFFQSALFCSYPQPATEFTFDQHTDIQYCTSDLQAEPRRMLCSYFIWISEVNEHRAPLMYRPGSHLLIAAQREKDESKKGAVPTVEGVKIQDLPDLPYQDAVPITARAGQASVLTTSTVHGASVNMDSAPRKSVTITFTAKSVKLGLPPSQEETKVRYDQKLKKLLRPERLHILSV